MTTLFPGSQDDFANPLGTDGLAAFGHAALHSNVNDAIEAIEAAIGTPDVDDPTSITARLEAVEAGGVGVSDHGALTGLADDDHSQYHTDSRGDARYAPIANGVTNGDSHDHNGGDGAQIAYANLSGLPTLGTAAALNVGTAASNVVQLNGSAQLPAVDGSLLTGMSPGVTDHGALTGLADDDHTQYPLGAGRAGGQTLRGGTAAGETLTLQSTAHATRGKLLFGSSAYDEVGNLLGVGVTSPTAALHLKSGSASAGTAPLKLQDGPLLTTPEAGAVEQQTGVLYHTDASSVRRSLATETFVEAKAANLMTNGAAELLNNRNWSTYTFDAIDTYSAPAAFRGNGNAATLRNDDLIPVDTTQRLRQSLWAKSGDIGGANYNAANRQYFATNFYDLDGLEIISGYADKQTGSVETTLALALNPGDLTITLTDSTGWYNSTLSSGRGFVWFGWANSKGYVYPDYTYSRNRLVNAWPSGGIVGNVITLNVPWAGPALPAGAAVRNAGSAANLRYNIALNVTVPNSWTRYEGSLSGFGSDTSNYRFGTAYVKFGHLVNYHGAADNNVRLANVRFNNLSSANLEPQIGVGATYKDLAQTALPANGLAVEGRVGVGTSIPSAAVHVVSTTEQVRFGYDANDYLALTVASDGKVAVDLVGSAGGCRLAYSDATSNAVYDLLTLSKNRNTGAGAVGLGVRLILAAKSSTTNDTPQGAVESTWVTATHASRKARVKFSAYDSTGAREVIRIEANGAAPLLGFYGVAAVAMPAALTAQSTSITHTAPGTPDYAIQALSSGGYGFATQDEGHTLLSVVANLQTRVGELETKLRSLGLLT